MNKIIGVIALLAVSNTAFAADRLVLTDIAHPTCKQLPNAQAGYIEGEGKKVHVVCWKLQGNNVVYFTQPEGKRYVIPVNSRPNVSKAEGINHLLNDNNSQLPPMIVAPGNGPMTCQPSGGGFQCY